MDRREVSQTTLGGFLHALRHGAAKPPPVAPSPKPVGPDGSTDWVAVCRRDSLLDGRARSVEIDGVSLAVFLTDGQVYATVNRCPHRDVPIDDGLVEEGCVSCPWHGWRFDLSTGEHITSFGRRRGLSTYPVIVADNTVWVENKKSVPLLR